MKYKPVHKCYRDWPGGIFFLFDVFIQLYIEELLYRIELL